MKIINMKQLKMGIFVSIVLILIPFIIVNLNKDNNDDKINVILITKENCSNCIENKEYLSHLKNSINENKRLKLTLIHLSENEKLKTNNPEWYEVMKQSSSPHVTPYIIIESKNDKILKNESITNKDSINETINEVNNYK